MSERKDDFSWPALIAAMLFYFAAVALGFAAIGLIVFGVCEMIAFGAKILLSFL